MAKLDNFTGLTRPQEDLLKKHYCFGSLALLNINLVNDKFTFHSRLSERHSEHPRASAWLQYKNDLFSLKGKKRNDKFSHYKLELTPAKVLQNLKAVFECKVIPDGSPTDATVAFEYNLDASKTKLSYLTAKNALRFQGTFGKWERGVGLDAKLDLEHLYISDNTLAVWCFKDLSRFVLKHVSKQLGTVGDIEISYLHKINEDTTVGSKVLTKWTSRNTSLEFGGEHKYDSNTWIKGKINSNGLLGLAVTRSVSSNFRVSLASELSAQSLLSHQDDSHRFGVRFDFSH